MNARYQEYLQTDYWKAVTKAVRARASFRCQVCNSPHDLQAHHRTYDHRGSELDHLDDLICLCARCHAIFHGKESVEPEKTRIIEWAKQRKQTKRQEKYDRENVDAFLAARTVPHGSVDDEMPPGNGSIILTPELISRCRANGAFTAATMRGLGLAPMQVKGWVNRLVGTEVSRQAYREALEGRFIYAKPVRPRIQDQAGIVL